MIGIQICSGTEWRATKPLLAIPDGTVRTFPYGEYVQSAINGRDCIFFWSRRTKTRAAGACQYAIDHWDVDPLFVLGTCGGVAESLRVMDVVFAVRTLQCDCDDLRPDMGRPVVGDHSWLDLGRLGHALHLGTIASADRDLTYDLLALLRKDDVLAADWESGAIALVCALNGVRWAVLRGISDVPHERSEADVRRQLADYRANTPIIMKTLLRLLPEMIASVREI